MRRAAVALVILGAAALAACSRNPAPASHAAAKPTADDARRFIADVDARLKQIGTEDSRAQWVNATYVDDDTDDLAARADDRQLAYLGQAIQDSRRYDGVDMDADTARQFKLLRLSSPFLPPKDPAKRLEMTQTAAEMQGMFASGKYCPQGKDSCRNLNQLEKVLADPANYTPKGYDTLLDAWRSWHDAMKPMRADYTKFVTLADEGARDYGYKDVGEVWRAGYDMPPDAFARDTDRLWGQVKPLYTALHCYVYTRLAQKYGKDRMGPDGTLPAHLLGNMWA